MVREKMTAIAGAVACLLSGVVRAQAAPDTGATADTTLNEIVVTAQRRAESLKDVPLSVTVASAAQLEQSNFSRPEELPFLVPSLQLTSFQDSPGATNFSVRGVGTESFSNLVEPSVATVIDGIVMSRPEMGVMQFSDIDHIEVLSGPQGMLFGKNASAGLVNIVTAKPKLHEDEFEVDGDWGRVAAADDPATYRGQVMANVAIGDNAALRFNGYFSNLGSLYKDLYANTGDFGQKQAGGKIKFLVEPTDALTININADYSESTGMGAGTFTQRSNGPASSFTPYDVAIGIVPSDRNVYLASNAPTTLHFAVGGISSEIAYNLNDDLTLTNILGYREYDSHYANDFDLLQVNIDDLSGASFHMSQITEEVRLASSARGPFNWQAGLYYYNGISDRTDANAGNLGLGLPAAPYTSWIGLNARNNEGSESYAAYGQGTYKLTDRFRLTGGLRVTHDKVKLDAYNYDGADYPINIAGVPDAAYDEEQTHTNLSGRVSAQYDVTPDTMTYATIATGYKGPGFNLSWSGSPGAAPVGPETSVNYELGIKTTVARQLALNASVYLEQFHDFQVQSYLPGPTPGTGAFIVQNAGQVHAFGIEAQAQWNVTHGLSFSSGLNYNDAVYTRFTGATCYTGQTVAAGCINGAYDATGNQLANSPRWTGTLGGDYKRDLVSNLEGFLHLDTYAVSTVNFGPNLDPNTVQKDYMLINGSFGVLGNDEKWKVSLYCRNCADRRFVTFIQSNPVGGVGDYDQAFSVDSFRTVGVAAKYRF